MDTSMTMSSGAARQSTRTGLCVLITNAFIRDWSGSELYVRDVATQLINRGHKPVVYSPRIGELADVLRRRSIPVLQDLDSIAFKPDLIHGQHHLETMTALARFPETPAVFVCHGWLPWEETPPLHPRIMQYVTVSDAVRDRLVYECGIPAAKITTILNSVDLEAFRLRGPLPGVPKRALVFSSEIDETNILDIVRQACARHGIALEVMGYASGNPSLRPEAQIGEYDIVFAHGRAALEGLAVGAAVICCGLEGAGPMVTTQNLAWLRRNNLGIRVHNRALTSDILSAEIKHYDPQDATQVCQEVRATAGLDGMVDQLLAIYNAALDTWSKSGEPNPAAESLALSAYLKVISARLEQVLAESNHANETARLLAADGNRVNERAAATQRELDRIQATWTWRLHQRAAGIPFVRGPLLWLIALFRRRHAGQKTTTTD